MYVYGQKVGCIQLVLWGFFFFGNLCGFLTEGSGLISRRLAVKPGNGSNNDNSNGGGSNEDGGGSNGGGNSATKHTKGSANGNSNSALMTGYHGSNGNGASTTLLAAKELAGTAEGGKRYPSPADNSAATAAANGLMKDSAPDAHDRVFLQRLGVRPPAFSCQAAERNGQESNAAGRCSGSRDVVASGNGASADRQHQGSSAEAAKGVKRKNDVPIFKSPGELLLPLDRTRAQLAHVPYKRSACTPS